MALTSASAVQAQLPPSAMVAWAKEKYTMTDIIMIPLSKLVESEDNVRRSDRRGGISQIAASIEAVYLDSLHRLGG